MSRGVDISKYATQNAAANIISRIRYGNIEVEDLFKTNMMPLLPSMFWNICTIQSKSY
jgi:hypothetical protein